MSSSWLYTLPEEATEGQVYRTGQPRTGIKSDGAYNAGLPCLNPHCKSHGKPHPNCKCYGGYAKGGEASPFCSEAREHQPDCQYFQNGGGVTANPSDYEPYTEPTLNSGDYEPYTEPAPNPDDYEPLPVNLMTPDDLTQAQQNLGTNTAPQIALGGVEAVGRGIFGPIPGIVENALQTGANAVAPYLGLSPDVQGLDYQSQALRQQANHVTNAAIEGAALAGSMYTGIGEGRLLLGAGEAAAKAFQFQKVGSGVLSRIITAAIPAAVSSGVVGAGQAGIDEASKYLLGTQDPQHAVAGAIAHIGAMGLLGAATGPLFNAATPTVSAAQNAMSEGLGTAAQELAIGTGMSFQGGQITGDISPAMKAGMGLGDFLKSKATQSVASSAASSAALALGAKEGPVAAAAAWFPIYKVAKTVVDPFVSKAMTNVAAPLVLKAATSNIAKIPIGALNYGGAVLGGIRSLNRAVDAVYTGASGALGNLQFTGDNVEKVKQQIQERLLDQEITNTQAEQNASPAGFAEGGEVTKPVSPDKTVTNSNGIEQLFPDHNMLIQQARGRVYNYLSQQRPQPQPKLTFDEQPDQTEQHRSYDRAIHIALNPLSVLEKAQEGTLEPEHIKHLQGMYPEVGQEIRKALTERITKAQVNKELLPSYKTRQSLSMLLGAPMDSTFTPAGITAAQATFASPQQQQPPPVAKKPKPSALQNITDDYRTSQEASALRAQSGK